VSDNAQQSMAVRTGALRTGALRTDPLVSVIIRTYNRSRRLQGAIESALHQTHRPCEVIVVDDGSTDDTRSVVERYGGTVRYVHQAHAGVSAALNAGIKEAAGAYLAFLDDDDLWRTRMVQRTVEALEGAGGGEGVAYAGSRYFIEHATERLIDPGWVGRSGDIFDSLIEENFIPINAVLVRRRCLEAVGGCDETLQGYEDWDLFLRIALAGFAFRYVDEPLALIRLHPDHQSADELMMKRSALAVVSKLSHAPGISPDRRLLIRRALARRHLSLGWYLALQDRREEGGKELRAASPSGFVQTAQKVILRMLTASVPPAPLRSLNRWAESRRTRRRR